MISMEITSQNTKKYPKEGRIMIIMRLKIHNFFAFKNFEMNMSYPKKIVDSYIEGEFLKGRENFRYKKINILMGANATGKTTLAQMLMTVFNFVHKKESAKLMSKVCDPCQEALFSMDFVVESYKLYRLDLCVAPDMTNEPQRLKVFTRIVDINKKDNYETCVKKIEAIPVNFKQDMAEELEKIEELGWMFSYPSDLMGGIVKCSDDPQYLKILDYTLRALDPSIIKVEKVEKVKNTYVIRMEKQDLVIQDGEVIKDNILSSGTQSGIGIALMLTSICRGACGFYYCDEKFSYVHSDVEKAFLNVMINQLKDNEQLFFTTHNTDILDLPLPKHTFSFLKKDVNDPKCPIKCINASSYLKRNTDSLRNAAENDLFSVAPNLELIYKMADL
nr:ATP-binding protein [uncultured Mediterraneibacter sp.]